jgi:hypothetical protein
MNNGFVLRGARVFSLWARWARLARLF